MVEVYGQYLPHNPQEKTIKSSLSLVLLTSISDKKILNSHYTFSNFRYSDIKL